MCLGNNRDGCDVKYWGLGIQPCDFVLIGFPIVPIEVMIERVRRCRAIVLFYLYDALELELDVDVIDYGIYWWCPSFSQ